MFCLVCHIVFGGFVTLLDDIETIHACHCILVDHCISQIDNLARGLASGSNLADAPSNHCLFFYEPTVFETADPFPSMFWFASHAK